MCGLSQVLGIKVATSMAYHLQMDRQTEHVNQEVEQFLRLCQPVTRQLVQMGLYC